MIEKVSLFFRDRRNILRLREQNLTQTTLASDPISSDIEPISLSVISSDRSEIQQSSTNGKIFANLDERFVNELIVQYQQGKRDFRGIDLTGLDLSGINLAHADLREANFFNCELRCANLDYADLRGANFKNTNLKAASLLNCDLRGANLTDTDLGHTILIGANLSNAIWERVNCHRTTATGATLPDGAKWQFRTFISGKDLDLASLIKQNQQSLNRRKGLAQFLVLVFLWCGYKIAKFTLPLLFLLVK